MNQCRRYNVHGRVQGVGFRASTQQKARELALTGWVRNDPQGFVEVLACGEQTALESLLQWLQHGPPIAEVSNVETGASEPGADSFTEFEIR